MRRFLTVLLACLAPALLISCGGNSTKPLPIAKVQIIPAPVTVNQGAVVQLTATAVDSNGVLVAAQPSFTFNVTNSGGGAISLSPVQGASVQLCAGTWDASFINCTPGPVSSAGTVTASGGGFTSDPVQVFVHVKVGRVSITTPAGGCVSSTGTLQLAAKAFDVSGNDVTSTVGPLSWASSVTGAATVNTNGLVTAVTPGHSGIFASVAGVNSVPFDFTTCLVESITLTASNLTLAPAATQQFTATVVDSQNQTIANVPLIFNVVPGAVGNGNSTGLVTALQPGVAMVVASCTPPTCNFGIFPDPFFPIYSNPLIMNVTGSTASTTFVTTSFVPPTGTSPTLVPIATSTNTAGTAITLPSVPNSIRIAPNGGKAYLGSDAGMMVVDLSSNAVTTVASTPGKVISISPNSAETVIASALGNQVFIVNNATNAITTFNVSAPATRADWSPDSYEAYIAAGTNLYVFSTNFSTRIIPLGGTATDVSFLTSGPFAYLAGPGAAINTFRTCDNSAAAGAGSFSAPALIQSLPDGSKVVATDSSGLDVITPSVTTPSGVNTNPCAAIGLSNSSAFVDFGLGVFTWKQIIVTPDSAFVFVLPAGSNKVLGYKTSDGSVLAITLAGGCTEPTSGGVTLDSAAVYVGCAGSNDIHVINVASGTDSVQVATSFKKSDGSPAPPDLVAVRPH